MAGSALNPHEIFGFTMLYLAIQDDTQFTTQYIEAFLHVIVDVSLSNFTGFRL